MHLGTRESVFGFHGVTKNVCPESSFPRTCWDKGVELATPSTEDDGCPALVFHLNVHVALKWLMLTVLLRLCRAIPPQDLTCSHLC